MSTIVTRAGKGSPLTHNEVDANFNNLNSDKYQSGDSPSFAGTTLSSGNLTFSSTGQRITGDMSNATESSRLAFQTSTANSATSISSLPNGTGTASNINCYNNSDPTNSSLLLAGTNATEALIQSGIRGTGTYLPMTFYTGGSERMRLDTSGNLLVGTSVQIARLGVVNPTGGYGFAIQGQATDGQSILSSMDRSGTVYTGNITFPEDGSILFGRLNTGSQTTRMTIDSSGNVGIGAGAAAFDKVMIGGTLPSSSAVSIGFSNRGTIPSSSTTSAYGFNTALATQAASFTTTALYHYFAGGPTLGAGSAISNQFGFYVQSTLTNATNNYGFFSDIASGSNRWNFYAAGTAKNYFAGQVGINKDPSAQLNVSADSGTIAYFQNSGGTGIYINAGDNTWTSASDERLKTDLAPIESAIEKLSFVRAVIGRYKNDNESVSRPFLIAQDVQKVFPQAVSDNNPDELGLRYSEMIPLLVAAIKELSAKVAALEAK